MAMPDTLEALRAGRLHGVQRLDLTGLGLRELPREVFALADTLEILDLGGNALEDLPADLPRLHRLRILFCTGNRFERMPEVLGRCPALEMVAFKSNRLREVPSAAIPPRLRWLILTDNQIEALPDTLGDCPRLEKLALAGNRLSALPASLARCEQLALLRLSANRFEELPAWLLTLPRLAWLAFGGNPLTLDREATSLRQTTLPLVPWGQLQIEALLGQGASGQIHRVRDATGRPQALKIFKGALTSDGLPGSELAAALQAGRHPRLIGVEARLSEHPEGADGLLMPLIDPACRVLAAPPSLDSCSRDVYAPSLRLRAATLLRMAAGLADALAHLHARGVAHGDLYAHNILHDGEGQAWLGDFGAASLLQALPPAQARAVQQLDVLAFGHLLDEGLARCEDPPPPALTHLCGACQHRDPSQRPPAGDLAAALRPFLD
jgi:hypothetical protein